jgi:membrane-bound ClpP family serine protease
MDSQFWAVILAVAGFALIAAEFFIPSGGMIALSCAGCFVGSVMCAYNAWFVSSPKLFWTFTVGLGGLIPTFLWFFLRTLERTSLGNNLLLPKTNPDEVVPYQDEAAHLERMVGRLGTTLTMMNPGGMVRVENERLHAFTEGMLMMAGEVVEVVEVRGARIVVRKTSRSFAEATAEPAETADPTPEAPKPVAAKPVDPDRLDFDIPQD